MSRHSSASTRSASEAGGSAAVSSSRARAVGSGSRRRSFLPLEVSGSAARVS
ncbi:hypothetical protein ACFPZ0_19785 [Streptomonospora nanhaiensis]|uniref:hypothetical protein n=1 Tax=Streptomonospora nanhaiensis TaxID=1323731 RepID=UPI001C994A72|nr:hypothetical protein [Streptomonospora nanhaiensis]MBX9391077.1 hypothetical protein [Streptomonospora nanhaiensis]